MFKVLGEFFSRSDALKKFIVWFRGRSARRAKVALKWIILTVLGGFIVDFIFVKDGASREIIVDLRKWYQDCNCQKIDRHNEQLIVEFEKNPSLAEPRKIIERHRELQLEISQIHKRIGSDFNYFVWVKDIARRENDYLFFVEDCRNYGSLYREIVALLDYNNPYRQAPNREELEDRLFDEVKVKAHDHTWLDLCETVDRVEDFTPSGRPIEELRKLVDDEEARRAEIDRLTGPLIAEINQLDLQKAHHTVAEEQPTLLDRPPYCP